MFDSSCTRLKDYKGFEAAIIADMTRGRQSSVNSCFAWHRYFGDCGERPLSRPIYSGFRPRSCAIAGSAVLRANYQAFSGSPVATLKIEGIRMTATRTRQMLVIATLLSKPLNRSAPRDN